MMTPKPADEKERILRWAVLIARRVFLLVVAATALCGLVLVSSPAGMGDEPMYWLTILDSWAFSPVGTALRFMVIYALIGAGAYVVYYRRLRGVDAAARAKTVKLTAVLYLVVAASLICGMVGQPPQVGYRHLATYGAGPRRYYIATTYYDATIMAGWIPSENWFLVYAVFKCDQRGLSCRRLECKSHSAVNDPASRYEFSVDQGNRLHILRNGHGETVCSY